MTLSATASGHSDSHSTMQNHIKVGAALTLRSNDMFREEQAYLLPGTMMGGEALAYEQGLSLDDAFLSGGIAWTEDLFVFGEIASHQHVSSSEVELEALALSYRLIPEANWYVGAGKLVSRVSPSARWHANTKNFTDAWLQADIHFGRSRRENGLRFSYETSDWQLGLEAFNGDSFPTAGRAGDLSLYGFKHLLIDTTHLRLGAWVSRAEAENRFDERYGQGHSHAGNEPELPATEYSFSGDVSGHGAYLSAESVLGEALSLLVDLEYLSQEHSGKLSKEAQTARIKYRPETYRLGLGVKRHTHTFKAQWEKLILKNRFEDDAGQVFRLESNLQNNDIEPKRLTFAWHWHSHHGIALKLEGVHEALANQSKSRNRLNIGLSASLDLLAGG